MCKSSSVAPPTRAATFFTNAYKLIRGYRCDTIHVHPMVLKRAVLCALKYAEDVLRKSQGIRAERSSDGRSLERLVRADSSGMRAWENSS